MAEKPAPPGGSPSAGIRVLSDLTLPPAFEKATDVRWAGDRSVYVAVLDAGAHEVSLDPGGPPPKEMIPGASKPGGFWSTQSLAVSSKFLAAASWALALTWRSLANPSRVEEAFEMVQGLDLREDRLAVVGARRDEKGNFGSDGAIAWIGTLNSERLTDLRPLLYDALGPGVPTMNRCLSASLGSTRFLANGSLVVVPGVQPGVHLYDISGKLVRTWDTTALGIDTDCGSLTEEQGWHFAVHRLERQVWLNKRRIVDSVLPLPGGPALVIRRVERGRSLWDLKILRLDGSLETHAIPIEGKNEYFHLKGDVRAGRLVFLLYETTFRETGWRRPAIPHVIVASPPQG